jgi:hypothetical protein
VVTFSSAASTTMNRASSHCLRTSASVAGRAMMSDGMMTEGEEGGMNSAWGCSVVKHCSTRRTVVHGVLWHGGQYCSALGTIARRVVLWSHGAL